MVHQYLRVSGKAIALASIGVISVSASGGELNPPVGPVRATMKSLDAIEPRVCINDLPGSQAATHVITEPGNYYLCADVFGEVGKDGIRVDFSAFPPGVPSSGSVVIDLNGFSLVGVAGSGSGMIITGIPGGRESVTLQSSINTQSQTNNKISGWGGDGVHFSEIENVCFSGLTVQDCAGDGVEVRNSGDGEVIVCGHTSHFLAGQNGLVVGLSAGATNILQLNDLVASGNSAVGVDILMVGSTVGPIDNGSTAIAMRNVTTSGNVSDGVRVVVDRRHSVDMRANELTSTGNGGRGIHIEGDRDLSMDASIDLYDTRSSGNGVSGFSFTDIVARLFRCVTRRNLGDGSTATDASVEMTQCSATDNGGNGLVQISGDLTVSGGTLRANGTGPTGGDGMLIDGAPPVIVNTFISDNLGNGVRVSNHGGAMYMRGSMVSGNLGDGVLVDNPLGLQSGRVYMERCIADGNGIDGFALLTSSGGNIRECVSSNNGNRGFQVLGVGHVFVWNSSSDNVGVAYNVILPGNSMGPATNEAGMPGLSNPAANFER